MRTLDRFHPPLSFLGPPLETGPLPALFYLALSAQDSLTTAPYDSPAVYFQSQLQQNRLRIFSYDLPDHTDDRSNYTEAIAKWGEALSQGEDRLTPFLTRCAHQIDQLFERDLLIPQRVVIGGLSRGAFLATLLAARLERVGAVVGWAPLIDLKQVVGTQMGELKPPKSLNLFDQIPHLYTKQLCFYIGNHDTRVGTHHTCNFILALARYGYQKRLRQLPIELHITPSIGYKGHGTAPDTFHSGARWTQEILFS